ncbi:MAG: glycosyltransferase [bacterium]|nr:glycosyltransferase [bacterium]
MKIAYVITQGECGGAQKNVLDTASAMKENGHDIIVCTGLQNQHKDTWLFLELRKKGFTEGELHVFDSLVREINPMYDLQYLYEMMCFIKKRSIDIVHLHSTKSGVLGSIGSKIAGAKTVYTVHGFVFAERISFFKKVIYILLEFLASFFRDLTITVSDFDMKVGQRYGIVRAGQGIVIYNGINENCVKNLLQREVSRNFLISKSETKETPRIIVGVVANLYKNKGINYLIDAAKSIIAQSSNDTVFMVVGEGEERDVLEKQIKAASLENNFFLLGTIPDAYKYLKAFDLMVLPSTKEGFPYVLIESMLAGVPFVATKVGGVMELTKYSGGDLIQPEDSTALSHAVLSALKRSNSEPVHLPVTFTTKIMLQKLQSAYTKLYKSK